MHGGLEWRPSVQGSHPGNAAQLCAGLGKSGDQPHACSPVVCCESPWILSFIYMPTLFMSDPRGEPEIISRVPCPPQPQSRGEAWLHSCRLVCQVSAFTWRLREGDGSLHLRGFFSS